MAFFLRYTDKIEVDMERQTSIHICDEDDEDAEFIEEIGQFGKILDGLCAFSLNYEIENEGEAIDEAIEIIEYHRKKYTPNAGGEEWGRFAYLIEGECIGDCIDGDLIRPIRVVANISKII